MKKVVLVLLLIAILPLNLSAWGDKGHKLITAHSLEFLKTKINLPDSIIKEIITRSVDPDNRKKQDPTEYPKHFIDIDFFPEYMSGQIVLNRDELKSRYPDSVLVKQGYLPWATLDTYEKLVDAFKSGEKEKIVLYLADLSHYVADGHQPLHATINYNGQLTGQKGIHFRYEIEMVDAYLEEIIKGLVKFDIGAVEKKDLEYKIFDYINESNTYVELILSGDKFASKNKDKYFELLWNRTKYVTIESINSAAKALADIVNSAYIEAGNPELKF